MTYKLSVNGSIIRIEDGAFIPEAPGNKDYYEYTQWLEAGNTPTQEEYVITPADVDKERDRRVRFFTFNSVVFQLDEVSQSRVTAMGADSRFAMLAGATTGNLRWADPNRDFGWIAADNTIIPMDAPTMSAFADAAKMWVTKHIMTARILKDEDPIPSDFTSDSYWT